LQGTLPEQKHVQPDPKSAQFAAPTQKKRIQLALLIGFALLLLIFGEHLSRNFLLPALAPRVDGTSNAFSVSAFSFLQRVDTKLCKALKCINRPVSDFSAWKIIAVTLTPENAREGLKSPANQSLLRMEIQNRLAIPVLLPDLEISLTDAEESEIKVITLAPEEWLPSAWKETHTDFSKIGAPAGERIQSDLPITLPANAAGYRVRVLYPQ
jgi:ribosomal protein L11 methyltransferase